MCDLVAQYDPAFQDIREQVKLLDFYSLEGRYPNALEEVIPAEFSSDRDAEQAIAMARIVIEPVQARMSLESGPDG
jgi:HEPN domain-containing protein